MNKEINYTGFSAVPDDYECPDGQLAAAINVIPEDGHIKVIPQPAHFMDCPLNGGTVVFIHTAYTVKHYIISKDNYIYWCLKDGEVHQIADKNGNAVEFRNITHLNAVGNTLLVFTNTAIHYILWKDPDYKYLGDHVPNIGISFGLVGHPRLFSMSDDSKDTFKVSFAEGIKDADINAPFSEKNKTSITSQVMAKVNKFIADQTVNKGRFCFPFLLRYALRLYDGTLICHSNPILMNPSTTASPVVLWNRLKGRESEYTEAIMDIMMVAATLDYQVSLSTASDFSSIPDWTDIIKSVDVFISKPLYTFDQNGECSGFDDSDDMESRFVGRLYYDKADTTTGFLAVGTDPAEDKILGPVNDDSVFECYAEWPYSHIYAFYFNQERKYPGTTLHLPEFSDDKEKENLRNCANFYKLCSIDIQTLYDNRSKRTDIKVEDEYLQSLVNREAMTDDYLTHDRLMADSSTAFNNRLNIAGVRRKLFSGFAPIETFAYMSPVLISFTIDESDNNKVNFSKTADMGQNSIVVYIKENGKDYAVSVGALDLYCYMRSIVDDTSWNMHTYIDGKEATTYSGPWKYHWPCYFFYPNVNAYRIGLSSSHGTMYIDLKPHDFLNGAYAVLDYNTVRIDNHTQFNNPTISYNPSEQQNVVSAPNKIYTSEVNNPFFFPVTGINTVGTGRILGIATAAKALSQGQFGQFPLYAFTDEGVWALELATNGLYQARQPITRDVCINPDSITQIDSAVLFATDRGIMLISGSQTQCITDVINSDFPFDINNLQAMAKLQAMAGTRLVLQPFSRFLKGDTDIKGCRMIYDYTHQRIILYNPSFGYSYVFSLKTKQWGMMLTDIASNINSYPEALAVDSSGNVVNFCADGTMPKGLLVTRPLKFGVPDTHKTIKSVIQRGTFAKGNVKVALYGSRDLKKWYLVSSSADHFLRGYRGTPWKYFRLAIVCALHEDESLYSATVEFDARLMNQSR